MKTQSYSGSAKVVGGTAEVDLTPPAGYIWLVTNISVTSNSPTSTCSVYLNSRFMCGTNLGGGDSADGSPIPVNSADTIKFVWNNATNGSICSVQIIVNEDLIGSGLL